MIARYRQDGPVEAAEESSWIRELIRLASMAEITARDHELGPKPVDQDRCAPLDRLVVACSVVEVREV